VEHINHIAIIMDGNGRWAEQHGKKRIKGHEKGAETVRNITTHCAQCHIPYLTLYAFSTENWKRPKAEIHFLMTLLDRYLQSELEVYLTHGIRLKTIGDLSSFSPSLQARIHAVEQETQSCSAMTQVLALNYGAKDELCRAMNKLVLAGESITQEHLENHLDTAGIPPVDMLIRTGGEQRLSNYLLWQSAYAELFFTQTLWPEFETQEFDWMLKSYGKRERRFGGVISSS
jgi:undecaprenyl diphosphate synthase